MHAWYILPPIQYIVFYLYPRKTTGGELARLFLSILL